MASARAARAIVTVLAVMGLSCLDMHVTFECDSSDQCYDQEVEGVCEPTHACSFPDESCPSKRRYGKSSEPGLAGQCAACGNTKVDPGEQCDDGNLANDDGCLVSCRWAACGDGYRRVGVEECDDGNNRSGDSCNSGCLDCKTGVARVTYETSRHCYFRPDDGVVTWEVAQMTCEGRSAHLVTYSNTDELTAVGGLFRAPGWVGMREQAPFAWITGENTDNAVRSRMFSGPDAGVPTIPSNSCILQSAPPFRWGPTPCATTTARAVCEQPIWVTRRQVDNHAYRMFFGKRNWDAANAFCAGLNGHLVTFNSEEEHSFVVAQFYGEYWIGGRWNDAAKALQWVTNEPLTINKTAPGEPDVNGCLLESVTRNQWHDRACGNQNAFVCEIE